MKGFSETSQRLPIRRRRFLFTGGTMFGLLASNRGDGAGPSVAGRELRMRSDERNRRETVIKAIAADPAGQFVAVAGDDHLIRIVDAQTMQIVKVLRGHSDLIQTLDFDPTGDRLVSAGNDGLLIQWNRRNEFQLLQKIQGPLAWSCVRFAPDGRELAAVGFESEVFLIGLSRRTGRPKAECDCTDLRAVDYRSDGQILAVAGRNGHLHLFERENNKLLGAFAIHQGRIHSIRFVESSPVVVSAGEDGMVILFDTEVRQTIGRIKVADCKLFAGCILDDKRIATAGSDNTIYLIDLAGQPRTTTLHGHTGSIAALAAMDGLLFSGGYDATLRRWPISESDGRTARKDTKSLLDR